MKADVRVPGVALPAGGLGRDDGGRGAAAGQRTLGEGVGGQNAPAAAETGRKHQVGEPDEPRIVLDERGLGLLDIDGPVGGGSGCGARGDIL